MKIKKFNILRREDGVSLVEVVASVVILSIILISFASFLPQMGKTNNQNENKQQAVNLAQKELIYWKEELEKPNNDFKNFLKNPAISPTPYSFIKAGDEILCNDDKDCTPDNMPFEKISIKTTSKYDINFRVKIIIKVKPDLEGLINAYQTTVIIYNDKNKNISETYGYIFYKSGVI